MLAVDDGWKLVDVEPEAVEVNGNGNRHKLNAAIVSEHDLL